MKVRIKTQSLERLARRAGVKSVAADCYPVIRSIILGELKEILDTALVINSEHHTRTLMSNDIYGALSLRGCNIGESTSLGTHTCAAK